MRSVINGRNPGAKGVRVFIDLRGSARLPLPDPIKPYTDYPDRHTRVSAIHPSAAKGVRNVV